MATPKRAARSKAAPASPPADAPSALVVKGLDANDIAALDRELEARRATLPVGATLSRNGLVVALVREALTAASATRKASP